MQKQIQGYKYFVDNIINMEAIGNIEIKDGFTLENPTLEIKGIFEALKEDDTHDFYYLECYFQANGEGTTHSRYWIVETQDVELEFNKIEELKVFK